MTSLMPKKTKTNRNKVVGVSQGLQTHTQKIHNLRFVAKPSFLSFFILHEANNAALPKTLENIVLFRFSGLGLLIKRVNKGY